MPSPSGHAGGELPLFLTVTETARLIRKGRTATYAAIERGDIPSVRVGRTLRVPRESLLALGTPSVALDRRER